MDLTQREGPLARWLAMVNEPQLLEQVCLRLSEGETLGDVAASWQVPRGRLTAWLLADEARYGAYRRALEVDAHRLVSEAVAIADGCDSLEVAKAKIRIETRFKVAGWHAKALYGDAGGKGGGTVVQVVVNRAGDEGRDEATNQEG